MSEILAKGPNFVFAKEFIINEYGQEAMSALIAALDPEGASVWQNALLDEAYPFSIFKHGIFALAEFLGTQEMYEMSEMYKHIADRSLNTVYKTFFRLANPEFVVRNYPRLWKRFFNAGTVEVPVSDKQHAVVKFILPEIFLDWLPPACLGWSQKAVEMAGGKYFAMRQLEKVRRDDLVWEVSYRLSWQ